MARSLRINFNDGWYHVMNRGASFRMIYCSNKDKEMFLSCLDKTAKQYDIEVHAYCLMANYYHLLIKTPRAYLSDAIRFLNSAYAR